MSRIGRNPVEIPDGVDVTLEKNRVLVKGPKGSLQKTFSSEINISKEDGLIIVTSDGNEKKKNGLHGLTRTLIANMIEGVTKGFEKILEISGVGYKALMQDRSIVLSLGFSHQITFPIPHGIDAAVDKQTIITLKGTDKELLGQVAANLRGLKEPEPYKGKGVKYRGEKIIRKAGKAGK